MCMYIYIYIYILCIYTVYIYIYIHSPGASCSYALRLRHAPRDHVGVDSVADSLFGGHPVQGALAGGEADGQRLVAELLRGARGAGEFVVASAANDKHENNGNNNNNTTNNTITTTTAANHTNNNTNDNNDNIGCEGRLRTASRRTFPKASRREPSTHH